MNRLDTQQREGAGGRVGAVEPFGRMAVTRDDHRHAAECGDPGELARRGPDVVEIGKRHTPVGALGVDRRDEEDPPGLRNRQAANRVGVQDREQHVVHADADAEHEHRGHGKARIAPHQPDGKPEIAGEGIEERQPPLVAIRLLDPLDAPELALRRAPGVGGRHPGGEVVLGEQVQVVGDLFLEPAFAPPGEQQVEHVATSAP